MLEGLETIALIGLFWQVCIQYLSLYDFLLCIFPSKLIYPLSVSAMLVPHRHVYLLLFERGGIHHYTTIRNFSILVGSQLSNHEDTVYCCKQCLHAYSTQLFLDNHAIDCCHAHTTKFPEDRRYRFTNIQKQLPGPFVVYTDCRQRSFSRFPSMPHAVLRR